MDNLISILTGPLGLLAGTIPGLIIGVIFEDKLTALWARTRRTLTRNSRGNPEFNRAAFKMGPLVTDCVIIEGDGENVIDEDCVYVAVNSTEVSLPAEMVRWKQEIAEREAEKKSNGEPYAWNGPNYGIERFAVGRTPLDEKPEIFLRLQNSDFFTTLATQQLDRPLQDGSTPRQKYIANRPLSDVPSFMACSLGVNVVLVTSDGQVLLSKRSPDVALFPGLWSVSANEAVSRSIDSAGRTAPNLYGVARRGLNEELALNSNEYDLRLLAFHVATQTNLWACDFIARLKDLTAEQLRERWTRGQADKWEHSEHAFVTFEPKLVIEKLMSEGVKGEWTTMAPAIFYLALVNEFGRERVERAVARASAQIQKNPWYR